MKQFLRIMKTANRIRISGKQTMKMNEEKKSS